MTATQATVSMPFLLEIVGVLDEARQMLQVAGGGEGARHGEQHDLLAREHILVVNVLDAVGRHDPEGGLGQAVSSAMLIGAPPWMLVRRGAHHTGYARPRPSRRYFAVQVVSVEPRSETRVSVKVLPLMAAASAARAEGDDETLLAVVERAVRLRHRHEHRRRHR